MRKGVSNARHCKYMEESCGIVWRSSGDKPRRPLYPRGEENLVSIAIVSLLVLVIVAIIAIPILIRVVGEAARRSPNRPEGEGDETSEGDSSRHSGPGRE